MARRYCILLIDQQQHWKKSFCFSRCDWSLDIFERIHSVRFIICHYFQHTIALPFWCKIWFYDRKSKNWNGWSIEIWLDICKNRHNIFIEPYKIIKKFSNVTYKLKLPDKMKLHPVFYISKLQCYIKTPNWFKTHKEVPPPFVLIDGYEQFVIEKILDHQLRKYGKKQVLEYLIKWLGYFMYQVT